MRTYSPGLLLFALGIVMIICGTIVVATGHVEGGGFMIGLGIVGAFLVAIA